MAKDNLSIIILAAGKGTRMKSPIPKVMHKIAGKTMLGHVIDAALKLSPTDVIIVVSEENESYIKNEISSKHDNIKYAIQQQQNGTADAVKSALNFVTGENILILYGDVPFITEKTLYNLINLPNEIGLIGFYSENPGNYGRLLIEGNKLKIIREAKDANAKELEVKYCNSGILKSSAKEMKHLINQINNNNAAGEYYLTDIIELANKHNLEVGYILTEQHELSGVNNKLELAEAETYFQDNMRKYFMLEKGTTLIDPKTVYFSSETEIEENVTIEPNVFISGKVLIKSGCHIKSNSYIEDVIINENVKIGPYARIRGVTIIEQNAQIGNFVEVKNSHIKNNAKINHLSYIGDSEIGAFTNIGAGVITCNYDGVNKHKTKVGDEVFVGSNSCLIAPIIIEDQSMIAAGSIINKDVENGDLAIARCKQTNIKNGRKKFIKK